MLSDVSLADGSLYGAIVVGVGYLGRLWGTYGERAKHEAEQDKALRQGYEDLIRQYKETLDEQIKRSDENEGRLGRRVASLQNQVEQLEKRVSELNDTLKEERERHEKREEALESEGIRLRNQLRELRIKCDEKDKEIQRLRDAKDEWKTKFDQANVPKITNPTEITVEEE